MKAETKKSEELRYSREELLAQAEVIFGCRPEVLAGAWHDRTESAFSVDETNELIHKFYQRKVQA